MNALYQRSQSAASSAVRIGSLLSLASTSLFASDAAHAEAAPGLPTAAPKILEFVNNSMIVTWVVAALIIWGARKAMANAKEVPTGGQNFWEFLVEGLHNQLN